MKEPIPAVKLNFEQIEQLEKGELVSIPTSWNEFVRFLPNAIYKVEYHQSHLILKGNPGPLHDLMVDSWATMLADYFLQTAEFKVSDGDTLLRTKTGCYHPDLQLCRGEWHFDVDVPNAINNPYLIVEVLSAATFNYDMVDKLIAYGEVPSLQTIVLVDYFDKAIYQYKRGKPGKAWVESVHNEPNESVTIEGFTFHVHTIFDKLPTY